MTRRPLSPIAIRIAELEHLIAYWRGRGEDATATEIQLAFWKAKP